MVNSIVRSAGVSSRMHGGAGVAHRWCAALSVAVTLLGCSAQLDAQAPVADSTLTPWRQRTSALANPAFAETWRTAPTEFRRIWDAALVSERVALEPYRDRLTTTQFDEELLRLRLRHAWGRVVWPYFHWRESDATEVLTDVALDSLIQSLPLEDERWWGLPEHVALRGALVHERARILLANRPALRRGDAQWLRAEFEAARELFHGETAQRRETTRLLLTHLDENDERGVDSVYARWVALRPDTASRQRVDSLIADHRAARAGHSVSTYRRIDEVPLEVHILRPTAGDTTGMRPAMLWFHGGSGTSGSWSHSPGIVRELRRLGIVVVSVEYRTGSRFDAGPIEQADDARAAFAYVQRHARRLRIDAGKIGVAGFSSGAGPALWLGTRGYSAHALDADVAASARKYPAAVITSGVCVDPAGPKEDGYFRKRVSERAAVQRFSPIDLIAKGQPRTLMIHAANDEYCDFADAERFSVRSREAGNDVTFVPVPNATHFFGFYDRPGQAIMRTAIAEALTRWGWQQEAPPPPPPPLTLDVGMGFGRTWGSETRDVPAAFAFGALVATPLRVRTNSRLLAGVGLNAHWPLDFGTSCIVQVGTTSCLPAYPKFTLISALLGREFGSGWHAGGTRVLIGPAVVRTDERRTLFGVQGRADMSVLQMRHAGLTLWTQGASVSPFGNARYVTLSMGLGVRLQ